MSDMFPPWMAFHFPDLVSFINNFIAEITVSNEIVADILNDLKNSHKNKKPTTRAEIHVALEYIKFDILSKYPSNKNLHVILDNIHSPAAITWEMNSKFVAWCNSKSDEFVFDSDLACMDNFTKVGEDTLSTFDTLYDARQSPRVFLKRNSSPDDISKFPSIENPKKKMCKDKLPDQLKKTNLSEHFDAYVFYNYIWTWEQKNPNKKLKFLDNHRKMLQYFASTVDNKQMENDNELHRCLQTFMKKYPAFAEACMSFFYDHSDFYDYRGAVDKITYTCLKDLMHRGSFHRSIQKSHSKLKWNTVVNSKVLV